jgi:hypothetical protein
MLLCNVDGAEQAAAEWANVASDELLDVQVVVHSPPMNM